MGETGDGAWGRPVVIALNGRAGMRDQVARVRRARNILDFIP